MRNGSRGFSLIEILVALAIVAILGSIAFPSYQSYIRKGHRADAQNYLMTLAQQNQQYFIDNRGYTSDVPTLAAVPASVAPYYGTPVITVPTTMPPTFSITATPIGSQASDSCGDLTINSAGTKSSSLGSGCW